MKKRFKKWKNPTPTSHSRRHLGHYKVVLARDDGENNKKL